MADSHDSQDASSQAQNPGRGPVDASAAGGPPPPPPNAPGGGPGHGQGPGAGPGQPPPPGYAPMYYAPPPEKSKRFSLKRVGMGLLVSLVILSLLANLYLGAFFVSSMFAGKLKETVYEPGDAEHRIAILPVEGMIDGVQADFARMAWQRLDQAPPAAVVLRVSSGGGGISASDEMLQYLKAFKASHPDVPVVASFGPVAASGGYYVAADADAILAERTTMTGSIGVIAQVLTFQGTLDKLGVQPVTLTADGSPKKDLANTVFRDWTERDKAVLQDLLNHAYDVFVEVVYEGRQQALGDDAPSMAEVREMASGSIFTAEQAVDLKLIDDVGYLHDALQLAARLANVPRGVKPQVTRITKPVPLSLLGLLGVSNGSAITGGGLPDSPDELRRWMNELGELRLEYRMASP